jgi:hypothetical protein
MEASSKLKALKFMKRGAPPTGPSEEENRLAEKRGLLAGNSRWRLEKPDITPSSRYQVVCDYSPSSAVQASQDSRRAFNKPKGESGDGHLDDVDPNLSFKKNAAVAHSAERKHKESLTQKAKQKHDCAAKK